MSLRRAIFAFLALAIVASALLAARSPVAAINLLILPGSHTLTANVPYGPHPRQQLDIYRPTAQAPAGGWPVIVFFHGGSWHRGERADYRFVGEALASRGVLTLVADYRLYPEVRYPEFLGDSAHALAYALEHATALGGNPGRTFVAGHSAGAYNAAMLALDARWLAAVGHGPGELAGWVGLAGPYDFQPTRNPEVQPVFNHPDYPPGSQPIDHASGDTPRALLGAAARDDLVNPQRNTVALARRLQAAGAKVTLHIYDRVDHVTLAAAFSRPLRWLAPVLDDVAGFVTAPAAN